MRWLFLLLFVLNGCYLVWNLQDAPVRAKEIASVSRLKAGAGDLQLLSESDPTVRGSSCVFIGGFSDPGALASTSKRLREAGIAFQSYVTTDRGIGEHWLRLPPDGNQDDPLLQQLVGEISGLQRKIIPCEGIATPE